MNQDGLDDCQLLASMRAVALRFIDQMPLDN